MIKTFILTAIGIISVMLLWIFIQSLWGKVFPEQVVDGDPMGNRKGCSGCSCKGSCINKK